MLLKNKWILVMLGGLSGCTSTSVPQQDFCQQTQCSAQLNQIMKTFDTFGKYKAFAYGKNASGEVYGYSYDYKSQEAANMRALLECQNRVDALKVDVECKIVQT